MEDSLNSHGLNEVFGDEPAPLPLFQRWIAEAGEAEHDDPTAFALATVDAAGHPSVRMLLLKGATEAGFVFYTNMNSRKAEELQGNPRASMCFHWKKLRRQLRVSGSVTLVSDAEADAYFASRDHASKVGAWASLQSSSMSSRGEFEQRVAEYRTKYPEGSVVPRPPHWSGWLLQPAEVEFWLDADARLHERLRYTARPDGSWEQELLYP